MRFPLLRLNTVYLLIDLSFTILKWKNTLLGHLSRFEVRHTRKFHNLLLMLVPGRRKYVQKASAKLNFQKI